MKMQMHLALSLLAGQPTGLVPSDGVAQWLAGNAVPLSSVEPGKIDGDLSAFGTMIGDARIVGGGEPTHGNREVYQLKHRLFEYLVRNKGFSLLGMEMPRAEAEYLNAYVLHGKGTASQALSTVTMWAGDTKEVADLLDWMRAWNEDPAHTLKLEIFGFDMQSPERAARLVIEAFEQADPSLGQQARSALGVLAIPFNDPDAFGYRPFNMDELSVQAASTASALLRAIDHNKSEYQKVWGEARWHSLRQHAQNLVWWIAANAGGDAEYDRIRDFAQAENVVWQVEQGNPGAKAFLWAHNVHLANLNDQRLGGVDMAGRHLKKRYGDDYLIVGIFFGTGGLTALNAVPWGSVQAFDSGDAPPGSLEAQWLQTGQHAALVDLRRLPAQGKVAQWFSEKQPTRHSGGGWRADKSATTFAYLLPEAFDILAFVAETTPSQLNSASDYVPVQPLPSSRNLDFDEGLQGWLAWSKQRRWAYRVSSIVESDSNRFARICGSGGEMTQDSGGSLIQLVDAAPYRGKTLRFAARTRSTLGETDQAFLRLRIEPDPDDSVHASVGNLFDSALAHPITLRSWQTQSVSTDVPDNAGYLAFGLLVDGVGCVDLDDVTLTAN